MTENFWSGFIKIAAEEDKSKEKHHIRRAILGNPISTAIEAKKGNKLHGALKALKHSAIEGLKGSGIGAAIGAAGAAAFAHRKGFSKGDFARLGAGAGANLGFSAGAIKGNHDAEATKIHQEHSKYKK